MTEPVELDRLLEVAEGFRTVPLLLTVDPSGRPRAAAVTVVWAGPVAAVRAGRRSLANATDRPLVSLLWPAPPDERFALLVDGEATDPRPDDPERPREGGGLTFTASSAILHVVVPRTR